MGITRDLEAKRLGLVHVDRPFYETEKGIHFPMAYGDRTVRVFVERASIVGGSGYAENCRARFEQSRDYFEFLAHEMFPAAPDRVRITITREIVLRHNPQT
jgi:hypothetical protein